MKTTLASLLATGQIEELEADKMHIQRLLDSARIYVKDAEVPALSTSGRLQCAFNAILDAALAALRANGYRPSLGAGSHTLRIQSLPETEGVAVDEASAEACHEEARRLIADVEAWIRDNRPGLAA